jgi:transcriptional regulator with XRE-family HTH domain
MGQEMRNRRKAANLTLEDLANAAGVSRSLVSQVERGVAAPSLVTLRRLAGALGVPIAALFGGTDGDDGLTPRLVVRKGERKKLQLPDSGLVYELLTADLNRKMEMLWGNVPPHATSPSEPSRHNGEEFVLVIDGSLVIVYEDEEHVLEPGDSIYFDCTRPHRLENRTDEHCQIVIAITPPSF